MCNTWAHLEAAFALRYTDANEQNQPSIIAEAEAFNQLRLQASQPLEQYHSILVEKATRLQKPDRETILKFIDGLCHSSRPFSSGLATSLTLWLP